MRAHATAILVAVAMMVPSGALAAAVCDGDMAVKGACCCDDGEVGGTSASIDAACCCELEAPLGHSEAHDAVAPAPSDDRAPVAIAAVATTIDDRPLASTAAVMVRSRGPPPDPTLVGQHILLLC